MGNALAVTIPLSSQTQGPAACFLPGELGNDCRIIHLSLVQEPQ